MKWIAHVQGALEGDEVCGSNRFHSSRSFSFSFPVVTDDAKNREAVLERMSENLIIKIEHDPWGPSLLELEYQGSSVQILTISEFEKLVQVAPDHPSEKQAGPLLVSLTEDEEVDEQ